MIEIRKGEAIFVVVVAVLILVDIGVTAFGTGDPVVFGHSAKELDLSGGVDGDAVFNGNIIASDVTLGGGLQKWDIYAEGATDPVGEIDYDHVLMSGIYELSFKRRIDISNDFGIVMRNNLGTGSRIVQIEGALLKLSLIDSTCGSEPWTTGTIGWDSTNDLVCYCDGAVWKRMHDGGACSL